MGGNLENTICCNLFWLWWRCDYLVRQMPGYFKRYSGCRGLVRRMPLLEQTRFGCPELANKYDFRTKTGELHQVIF